MSISGGIVKISVLTELHHQKLAISERCGNVLPYSLRRNGIWGFSMTGSELREIVSSMGYSTSELARRFDVDPDTITNRYRQEKLSPVWQYAVTGLMLSDIHPHLQTALAGVGCSTSKKKRPASFQPILAALDIDLQQLADAFEVDPRTVRRRGESLAQDGLWRAAIIGYVLSNVLSGRGMQALSLLEV